MEPTPGGLEAPALSLCVCGDGTEDVGAFWPTEKGETTGFPSLTAAWLWREGSLFDVNDGV